mgnify:FL=1
MSAYQWHWGVIFEPVPDTGEFYYQWLLSGLGWTLTTALAAWCIALVVGTLVGVARTVPNRLVSGLATAYVELFRNIPLIVQMFLWFFVLPEFLPTAVGNWVKQDMPLPAFSTAVMALGIYTAARIAEQVRTGILTLSRGQKNAGLAMGLTLWQTYRYVLLPVAFRVITPPLTSEFMNIFKNSAVALVIGLTELTFQMRQITGEYAPANPIEVMTITSVLYLLVAFSANRLMAWLERKTRIPGTIGGGQS